MKTLERILILLGNSGASDQEFIKAIGAKDKNLVLNWRDGITKSYAKYIEQIADYFNVSTDYLHGRTDDPSPRGEKLTIPHELKGVQAAFNRGEFEDLTQDEINALAVVAKTLKAQRKGE